MKLSFIICLIAFSINGFCYSVTNSIAWVLAEAVYTVGYTAASAELSLNVTTIKEQQKLEAKIILNDAQEFYHNGQVSAFLASKINLAQDLYPELSTNEAVDQLVESANIILN